MRSIKSWLGVGLGLVVAAAADAVEVQTSATGVRYLSGGITAAEGSRKQAVLPPGRYKVEVTFQDETLAQMMEICAAAQRELVLRFRSDAEVSALSVRR